MSLRRCCLLALTTIAAFSETITITGPENSNGNPCSPYPINNHCIIGEPLIYQPFSASLTSPASPGGVWTLTIQTNYGVILPGPAGGPVIPLYPYDDTGVSLGMGDFLIQWNGNFYGIVLSAHDGYVAGNIYKASGFQSSLAAMTAAGIPSYDVTRPLLPVLLNGGGSLQGLGTLTAAANPGSDGKTSGLYTITVAFNESADFLNGSFTVSIAQICANGYLTGGSNGFTGGASGTLPDLTITKSHNGSFTQGQTGATYTILATNSGSGPTTASVSLVDALPAGLTATAIGGNGWVCVLGTLTCTTATVEAAGASFPAITLVVDVAANAPSSVTNCVTVSGGGETNTSNDTACDQTTVIALVPPTPAPDVFQIRYAANLNAGDSYVDITNSGASGGNICANVFTFDQEEELISCCACNVTPNALQSLSVLNSLVGNPLTPAVPAAVVIKLVASNGTCDAAVVTQNSLAPGLLAWGTSLHAEATSPITYGLTETPFSLANLSSAELAHITSTCGFIQSHGSGFGICKGCSASGLGASASIQ